MAAALARVGADAMRQVGLHPAARLAQRFDALPGGPLPSFHLVRRQPTVLGRGEGRREFFALALSHATRGELICFRELRDNAAGIAGSLREGGLYLSSYPYTSLFIE